MANCNSCNGGCQTGTRVGALNSICRTGCRYPYYTGPCAQAGCTDGCGKIVHQGISYPFEKGESYLFPKGTGSFEIKAEKCELLLASE